MLVLHDRSRRVHRASPSLSSHPSQHSQVSRLTKFHKGGRELTAGTERKTPVEEQMSRQPLQWRNQGWGRAGRAVNILLLCIFCAAP